MRAEDSVTGAGQQLIHEIASLLAYASVGERSRPAYSTERVQFLAVRRENEKKLVRVLSGYSPATIRRMADEFTESERSFIAGSILSHEESEEVINDLISFRKLVMESKVLGFPTKRSLYVRGISQYEHIEPQIGGKYPARRLAQGEAVLKVAEHLKLNDIKNESAQSEDGKKYARIAEPEMRELIMTSDDPLGIASIIIGRSFTSAAQVKDFLAATNGIAVPVQGGAL